MRQWITKFRVWDKKQKEMIYFDLFWKPQFPPEIKETLMSCSIMIDSRWNELYEGDIVEDLEGNRYEVCWVDALFGWMLDFVKAWRLFMPNEIHDITLIWNIYKNPKLLR